MLKIDVTDREKITAPHVFMNLVASLVAGLLVISLLFVLFGVNPVSALIQIFAGSFGNDPCYVDRHSRVPFHAKAQLLLRRRIVYASDRVKPMRPICLNVGSSRSVSHMRNIALIYSQSLYIKPI